MGGAAKRCFKFADLNRGAVLLGDGQYQQPAGVFGSDIPAQSLLGCAAVVKGLAGDVRVLGFDAGKGFDGAIGQHEVDGDDDAKGPTKDCQNMPSGQFAFGFGHLSFRPLKTVSLCARSPVVKSSTHRRMSTRS